jgi:ankyrin repeat protein
MEHLFDPAKPYFVAWVWVYDIDRHWIEPMSKSNPTQPEALSLYYTALSCFHGLVEYLIAAHSQDINGRGSFYTTALHAASVRGYSDVASLLIKNGADPNSRDDRDRAPLHKVPHGGQLVMVESSLEVARLLVSSGADVNVTDDPGWTPLHAAARSGYRDVAELLLEYGASLDVQNECGETPLHLACVNGTLEVVRFLIGQGSDINYQKNNGIIPLHMASQTGHLDVARLLLDCGSDVHGTRWTPRGCKTIT